MPYLTREDGERFVIPSYRDVLTAKSKSALRKEVVLLSQSYGEYITLQKKGGAQYEIAFSPDAGYLLGESIWQQFKRPLDLIYCEAIPNTSEAILVIVKQGSVYLDGRFPTDTIPEELVIFLTQQNNFEIYTYGDVPISQSPEDGKFSFEASSVKAFTLLDKPVFPSLPLLKMYQLRLVDVVLKDFGIGVFPLKQVLLAIIALGVLYFLYNNISFHKVVQQPMRMLQANPYQGYYNILTSPAPDQEINQVLSSMQVLYTMPGWVIGKVNYSQGIVSVAVISRGGKAEALMRWANQHGLTVSIKQDGIYVQIQLPQLPNRARPNTIFPLDQIIAELIDRLATVYPGNNLQLGEFVKKDVYTQVTVGINMSNVSPIVLSLVATQLKDLPLVLQSMSLTMSNGSLSGIMTLEALGS